MSLADDWPRENNLKAFFDTIQYRLYGFFTQPGWQVKGAVTVYL